MDVQIYIDGLLRDDLRLLSLMRSYVRPWTAELLLPDRHDAAGVPMQNDEIVITSPFPCDEVTTTTTAGAYWGTVIFRGNVTRRTPGGIAGEGVYLTASDKRFRLENEPIRINGRGHYIWNRRGYRCENESGEDSPNADGTKWRAGQIIIDILEHALGMPGGGSDIPGHHSATCNITDTFFTADDVSGYTAADWLALDSMIGEFSVDNTPVAQAIDVLLGLNGGFYGWYIEPSNQELILVNLDACPVSDLAAGELGHWQDEAGKDYVLLDNRLDWDLDGVCSTIVVQGTDRTTEEIPANLEGIGNPGHGDEGELELVAAPWLGYGACYRVVAHGKRYPAFRELDPGGVLTPPAGFYSWYDQGFRIYYGTAAGAKWIYDPGAGQRFPIWNRVTGMIMFDNAPALAPGDSLYAWHYARIPFEVQAGPTGDAYYWYGYERTRVVYDPAFKHITSWPTPGTADDQTAMGVLAHRLLRLYKDVRRQGTFECDGIDFCDYRINRRYNVVNLTENTDVPQGTTTSTMPPNPAEWSTLRINAVEVQFDFEREATMITVANTFFMLEDYSEIKRRLEQNLFARRELDLSEDINDCQFVVGSAEQEEEDYARETTTTTMAPTTTTTVEPEDLCRVRVSDDDLTCAYLNGKLVAGTHIAFTENNPTGDETLTIAESGTRIDNTQTLRLETRVADPDAPTNGDIWLRTDL